MNRKKKTNIQTKKKPLLVVLIKDKNLPNIEKDILFFIWDSYEISFKRSHDRDHFPQTQIYLVLGKLDILCVKF